MPSTSRKVIAAKKVTVNCDICGDEMQEQRRVGHTPRGYACFPCKNYIPADQLYRYAEHVNIEYGEIDNGN